MATFRSMDCGMEPSIAASSARMRSTVSMILAPGWRKIITSTDGLAVGIAGIADVFHGIHGLADVARYAPADPLL